MNPLSHAVAILRRAGKVTSTCGPYTLEQKIGEGAMGTVWRARHAFLARPAAVKLLPAHRMDVASIRRFEREAELASQLTHPNAVTIYDFGRTREGTYYYAMELVDGVDLERLVEAEGALAPERAVRILLQLCGALAEAHELGLVHRDVKPSNVMLARRRDTAKLVDFGLVKSLGLEAVEPSLTATNSITGSPMYMAPEAIQAPECVDARSDLYALGVLGWFLLAGSAPFEGGLIEVCSHHLHTPPPRLSKACRVPAAVEDVLLACMAKRPEDRPADADAVRRLLEEAHLHA
jgi:serine/threonine-protein kinase